AVAATSSATSTTRANAVTALLSHPHPHRVSTRSCPQTRFQPSLATGRVQPAVGHLPGTRAPRCERRSAAETTPAPAQKRDARKGQNWVETLPGVGSGLTPSGEAVDEEVVEGGEGL